MKNVIIDMGGKMKLAFVIISTQLAFLSMLAYITLVEYEASLKLQLMAFFMLVPSVIAPLIITKEK